MALSDAEIQVLAAASSQIPFWDHPAGYTATPQEQWSAWDKVYVDGNPLPGLGRVVVTKKPRIRLQKRKEHGTDGDNPLLMGYDPAELVLELSIWTPQQLLALQQFEVKAQLISTVTDNPVYKLTRLLETPKLSKTQSNRLITVPSIHVSHPSLTLAGIGEMFIYSITPFEEGRALGIKMLKVHGYERFDIGRKNAAQGKPGAVGGAAYSGQPPQASAALPTKAGYPAGRNPDNYVLAQSPETQGFGFPLTPGSDPAAISPTSRLGPLP